MLLPDEVGPKDLDPRVCNDVTLGGPSLPVSMFAFQNIHPTQNHLVLRMNCAEEVNHSRIRDHADYYETVLSYVQLFTVISCISR